MSCYTVFISTRDVFSHLPAFSFFMYFPCTRSFETFLNDVTVKISFSCQFVFHLHQLLRILEYFCKTHLLELNWCELHRNRYTSLDERGKFLSTVYCEVEADVMHMTRAAFSPNERVTNGLTRYSLIIWKGDPKKQEMLWTGLLLWHLKEEKGGCKMKSAKKRTEMSRIFFNLSESICISVLVSMCITDRSLGNWITGWSVWGLTVTLKETAFMMKKSGHWTLKAEL